MSSPYESGEQKVIPAVLLYAFYHDQVLMMHRNLKDQDFHEGKWNGLGGKLEPGESPIQAAVREFSEEAGSKTLPSQWQWMGQLFFPNFKPEKSEDWWVTVFTLNLNEEQSKQIKIESLDPQNKNTEGTLHWVARDKVNTLNLWDGDHHFIPLAMAQLPFEGTFFYENGKCKKHELRKIPHNSPNFSNQ